MIDTERDKRDQEYAERPQPDWAGRAQNINRFAFLFTTAIMIALAGWVGVTLVGLHDTEELNTYKIDQIKTQTDSLPSLAQQVTILASQILVIQGQVADLERRQEADDIDRAKRADGKSTR